MVFSIIIIIAALIAAFICYNKYLNRNPWKLKNKADILDIINKTRDESLLAKIVLNTKHLDCQKAALAKITNSRLLKDIALNLAQCPVEIRKSALLRLDRTDLADAIDQLKSNNNPSLDAYINDAEMLIKAKELRARGNFLKGKIESQDIKITLDMPYEDINCYYTAANNSSRSAYILESWSVKNKRCYICGGLMARSIEDIPHYDSNHDYVEYVAENVSCLKCAKCHLLIRD